MLRSLLLLILLSHCVFALVPSAIAATPVVQPREPQKHIRILTVGNSFTHNATRYLDEIIEASGHQLTHKMLSIGGSSLEQHATKAMAFEQDPVDKSARYASGESLQEALRSEPWDFVTIQQVSIKSHDVQSYRPHAQQLAEIIRREAPQAKLLVHQTWAYRVDDPRFSKRKPVAGEPASQQAMYEGLSEAYHTITAELSARRIPVGDAFWMADNDTKIGYCVSPEFDAGNYEPPQLPEQQHSLHVGYRWSDRNGRPQLGMDGHHANVAGEYLGACVWFECLYGESPVGNSFVPKKLDAEFAAQLQAIAHQAAQQGGDVATAQPNE
ncbi:DUF4886 domain-containing protein [Allorhodopirellula heiligendammensis]|uniref:DUF4886 domain-containing protein n=1 Tax=Allorhodopirellula heiligendammensis TaxID=2714739 RepID=A0A5C6BW95_9BACT|nr:DUF4886 domain-containing protein [Allorhodopirellula heiligendammensis]TWU15506.1 hypothetical protein Poly21_27030 [Allorhodopirellula heiligendammensis]